MGEREQLIGWEAEKIKGEGGEADDPFLIFIGKWRQVYVCPRSNGAPKKYKNTERLFYSGGEGGQEGYLSKQRRRGGGGRGKEGQKIREGNLRFSISAVDFDSNEKTRKLENGAQSSSECQTALLGESVQ